MFDSTALWRLKEVLMPICTFCTEKGSVTTAAHRLQRSQK